MEKIFQKNAIIPLLGNEAIVLGALESGVGFVATYPGTPASEIGDLFYGIKDAYRIYMEYSTNEIVALEAAAGAAYSGVRALVAMKHFGVNVAMDALIPIAYTRPRAGLVIIIADDPGCHSSAQSEQDSRVFIENLNLVTLEPADPSEAKEFTKLAFEISEKFQKAVIIRTTTRVAHQTAAVKVGKIPSAKTKGKFLKDLKRFNTAPPMVLSQKRELLALKKPIENYLNRTKLNPVIKGKLKNLGVIASGAGYLYCLEALENLNVSLDVLKIDTFYPLPAEKIRRFLENKKKVLVVEEVIGLIEEKIKVEVGTTNEKIEILGKNLLEPVDELNPDKITEVLAQILKRKYKKPEEIKKDLVKRTPRFCQGCPYWSIFSALKNAVDSKKVIFVGDIGCYMMGYYPPFELQDILLCMAASVGVSHGIAQATNQKVIALMGDSTLFHAGLPGLLNIVNNNSNPLIIIFDNGITAMTGRQPHPGTPLKFKKHDGKAEIKIEKLLRAIGIKNIVLDPVRQNKTLEKRIKEFISKKEAAAIICRHPCVYIGELEKSEMPISSSIHDKVGIKL
ncbi:indolepyruvate ferredoxin oxidoreductase subunit alpha [Candidatus Wolfebacteria bacterium CG03_land_8_20_14_0_80_39_317]|uniref:Indolepyruvate oxidoreductase subunit IorA n=3 Tax=Candidatus Wolfeibacteriota TaxID=1752735 RepID=A0A2M7B6Z3_9BACT|nr:MAG: indolepyruvate ferredoxin oxidoreductase subunit alpha [Candidatus Wolfebacteria bacterium CG03_land_8_20_14_0_80_39_317]